jgi:hypothetical protein
MLAFLRDANTSASVIRIINLLDKVLGKKTFDRLFPVILTDNGSEFSNPKEIERRDTVPYKRTNVWTLESMVCLKYSLTTSKNMFIISIY